MAAAGARSAVDWITVAERLATDQVAPLAGEIDRTDRLPTAIRAALASSGLMSLSCPAAFGGAEADMRTIARVLEILATASAAVATVLSVHLSVAVGPIVLHGTPVQHRTLLPRLASGEWLGAFALTEPAVGSDAARLTTHYRRTEDGFRLRGNKMFTTSAESADVIVLFATRDPAEGHRGISAFAVPKGTPGLSVGQRLDKMGIRGSETVELVLDDARVPISALLGPEGEGFRIALQSLAGGRIGIAACALGVARAAFAAMRTAAQEDPADWKRAAVARAYSELEAAAALVGQAAELKDRGAAFVDSASAAKLFSSQAAVHIANAGLDVAGRNGLRAGSVAERLLRDARVFPIVEGTTEIQELILGRDLIGR
ncbi:MAG: acyl-CoA dehydrogenase family protein [Thermoplasmata archaeon]|nr:acyl-CoA dehydrogenase family protein [Thermoplasmata archaeon]